MHTQTCADPSTFPKPHKATTPQHPSLVIANARALDIQRAWRPGPSSVRRGDVDLLMTNSCLHPLIAFAGHCDGSHCDS